MTPSILQRLGKVASDVSYDHVGGTKNVGPANLLNKDMNATEHARQRRELLDMMNRLHTLGLAADIELPQIACIGSQSVGKSSLIESISGIALPRASGTCTRCPIECRLRGSTDRWSARVLLRFENGRDGYAGLTKEVEFGAVMMSRDHVPERIRRAQLAILNPAIEHNVFLSLVEDTQYPTRSFSQNCVIVELSAKNLSDLNFVDLPGLIANVSDDKNIGDIQLVENLVASYISRPSCLILLAVSCENDYENQGAGRLASKYDPNGKRTIGVLTKPDRIERGEESPWISMITGQSNVLRHGWFSVKQPTSCELEAGISWEDARAHDSEFFESTAPWSTIPEPSRRRLGCSNLIHHLGETLVKVIVTRLPHICHEVDKLINSNDKKLFELPDALSRDPLTEVMQLITSFTRDLEQQVRGDPGSSHTGLVQQLLSSAQAFQDELREITPIFMPRKKQAGGPDLDPPSFLPKAEKWPKHSEETTTLYLDDVVELAEGARTRELPGEFPFAVKEQLISRTIESWNQPVSAAFERAGQIFLEHLTSLVDKHFAKHTHGGLRTTVMKIVMDILEERKTETQKEIGFLLDMESLPFTLNSHYYMDYKEKFLRYYTANSDEQGQLALSLCLEPTGPFSNSSVEQALRHLREAGFGGLVREDLIKLLPSDFSRQSALDIMASTRAYYQVAYKRFADTIPLAIDRHCVRAFNRIAQAALIEGLRLGEPDARKRCEGWISEPASVERARAELGDKKIRLNEARRELREVPGVKNLMRKRMSKHETERITQKSKPETRPNPSATLMPTSNITGQGTSSPAYVATVLHEYVDGGAATLHYQSISSMPTYSYFSVEELRVQDYTAGRKSPASSSLGQTCVNHD